MPDFVSSEDTGISESRRGIENIAKEPVFPGPKKLHIFQIIGNIPPRGGSYLVQWV
jgi:hypothetical protein